MKTVTVNAEYRVTFDLPDGADVKGMVEKVSDTLPEEIRIGFGLNMKNKWESLRWWEN